MLGTFRYGVGDYRDSSFLTAQLRAWGRLVIRKLMVNGRDPGPCADARARREALGKHL